MRASRDLFNNKHHQHFDQSTLTEALRDHVQRAKREKYVKEFEQNNRRMYCNANHAPPHNLDTILKIQCSSTFR